MRRGAFPEGRLPPEADLARRLGVSRSTVRAALQSLAEEGVVSRRRRHGTVVNEHVLRSSLPLNRLVSFRALVEQAGYAATVDPLVRRIETAPRDARAALGLDHDTPCLTVERLVRADGEPVVTVVDVLALERLLVAPDDVKDADSTFAFVAKHTGIHIDHSTVELVPRVADADGPGHLELAPGTPYLELRETLYAADHERVAFSRIAVDDSRIRLALARRDQ
jgi:DNA-binding GntR family transcriptional regulator